MKKNSRKKVILFTGIFLLFISFIFIIFFELIGFLFFRHNYFSQRYNYPQHLFLEDDEIGYVLSPNFKGVHHFEDLSYKVFVNDIGCFDFNKDEKYIKNLTLGDSNAWGFVPKDKRFSEVYADLKSESYLNCAVTGSSPIHQYYILERLYEAGYNFKNVFFAYTMINDFEGDISFPHYKIEDGYRYLNNSVDQYGNVTKVNLNHSLKQKIISMLYQKIYLYRLINRAKRIFLDKKQKVNVDKSASRRIIFNALEDGIKEKFNLHLDNLKKLQSLVHKNGGNFILINCPTLDNRLSELKRFRLVESYALDFFKKNSIDFINFKPTPDMYHRFNGHLNITGHEKIAQHLYDAKFDH